MLVATICGSEASHIECELAPHALRRCCKIGKHPPFQPQTTLTSSKNHLTVMLWVSNGFISGGNLRRNAVRESKGRRERQRGTKKSRGVNRIMTANGFAMPPLPQQTRKYPSPVSKVLQVIARWNDRWREWMLSTMWWWSRLLKGVTVGVLCVGPDQPEIKLAVQAQCLADCIFTPPCDCRTLTGYYSHQILSKYQTYPRKRI